MLEYRLVKKDYKVLKELGKENWVLSCIDGDVMIFYKKATQKREAKIIEKTPQFEQFLTYYRKEINNKGSYDDRLMTKYNTALKDLPHTEQMEKLEEYKKHLEVYTTKNPLQLPSYLNQKRYMDTYETVKVNHQDKWMDDVLRERKIPQEYKELILGEKEAWKASNPTKEVTTYVFDRMIEKYYLNNR